MGITVKKISAKQELTAADCAAGPLEEVLSSAWTE